MRIRKKPHTEEKLQDFSDFVTVGEIGEEKKGSWRKLFSDDLSRELFVELGAGKGDFITALAERNLDKNFLGLEMEKEVVLKAARKIEEKNLPRKPNPTRVLEIAKSFSVQPEEVAYFGDTAVDMQTANNAGFLAVGVSWGFRPQELQESGAKVIIDTPQEILNIIDFV